VLHREASSGCTACEGKTVGGCDVQEETSASGARLAPSAIPLHPSMTLGQNRLIQREHHGAGKRNSGDSYGSHTEKASVIDLV
jgi:hypothetical protein